MNPLGGSLSFFFGTFKNDQARASYKKPRGYREFCNYGGKVSFFGNSVRESQSFPLVAQDRTLVNQQKNYMQEFREFLITLAFFLLHSKHSYNCNSSKLALKWINIMRRWNPFWHAKLKKKSFIIFAHLSFLGPAASCGTTALQFVTV